MGVGQACRLAKESGEWVVRELVGKWIYWGAEKRSLMKQKTPKPCRVERGSSRCSRGCCLVEGDGCCRTGARCACSCASNGSWHVFLGPACLCHSLLKFSVISFNAKLKFHMHVSLPPPCVCFTPEVSFGFFGNRGEQGNMQFDETLLGK